MPVASEYSRRRPPPSSLQLVPVTRIEKRLSNEPRRQRGSEMTNRSGGKNFPTTGRPPDGDWMDTKHIRPTWMGNEARNTVDSGIEFTENWHGLLPPQSEGWKQHADDDTLLEAYAEEMKGDLQGDVGRVDQKSKSPEEETGSIPLEHSGVVEGVDVSGGIRKRNTPESFEICTDPAAARETSDEEPIRYSAHSGSPNEWSEPFNTDGTEDTEDGDAIMVGVVGSAAPWFLTGWTNDVEVEFMIDSGCQVTILATSVFEKMCKVHPEVKTRISLCMRRLVSADSSPLTVVGWINLDVVFPGLQCNMCCVVANIGSDGLLGTEALQSCLPHQLDLRTGQLWAEGRSTLQLHQQKPTPNVTGLLLTAVVLPPDSEVVASFSINGGQLGSCALIDPNRDLTEEFGVVVGHTLVDASTPSANVLIINPNAEEVVLPCGSGVGK